MKKFLLLLALVAGVFLVYKFFFKKDEPKPDKPKPIAVSKHSEAFNQSVNIILTDYYNMNGGFVNWDSTTVNQSAGALQKSLNGFRTDDLKIDSTIYQTALFPLDNAKNSVATILTSGDWAGKRRALQDLSDNLRTLLITVKYDQGVVYWQECPMAFGEGMAGNWLSNKEEVVNPYLGNKDPQFGASMLNCGETKMKIDFTAADTSVVK